MGDTAVKWPASDRSALGKVAVTCTGGLAVALWTESFWIGAAAYYGLLLLAMAASSPLTRSRAGTASARGELLQRALDQGG